MGLDLYYWHSTRRVPLSVRCRRAFLRTPVGRELLRQGVIRRSRKQRAQDLRISQQLGIRLLALILLALLAMALGAWFGVASDRDRWIGDDRSDAASSAPGRDGQRDRAGPASAGALGYAQYR